MPDITITIPDAILCRVTDAVGATYDYTPACGLDCQAFVKEMILRWLKDTVVQYEMAQAQASAQALVTAAAQSAQNDIQLS